MIFLIDFDPDGVLGFQNRKDEIFDLLFIEFSASVFVEFFKNLFDIFVSQEFSGLEFPWSGKVNRHYNNDQRKYNAWKRRILLQIRNFRYNSLVERWRIIAGISKSQRK